MTKGSTRDADAKREGPRYDVLSMEGLAAIAVDHRETIRPGVIGHMLTSPFGQERTQTRHAEELARLPRIPLHIPDEEERLDTHADDDVRIVELLGEGGMGRVYAAKQRSLGREVAVKALRSRRPDESMVDTIIAEARVTGRLDHPNVIPVHQLGLDDRGRPVIVMKRVVGVSWSTLIEQANHPSWTKQRTLPKDHFEAHLRILMAVADALAFAHSRGFLHRDVKPANVMVGEFGEVYLADWGVAHAFQEGPSRSLGLVGTPCYLAPEMLDDTMDLGPYTDVYLLGATLHTVLTGEPRHDGVGLVDVLRAAHTSAPFAYGPKVPEELAALCNRATSREPSDRPESALAFRRAIEDYLTHRTSLVLSAAADERLAALERRREEGADVAELVRLVTESRFGHLLAAREWEDNPRARVGLRRCLELSIGLELARENAEAARALLAELDAPPDAIVRAIEALEARSSRRSLAEATLERIARENDIEVTARVRKRIMLGLVAFALVSGLCIAWYEIANDLWGKLPAEALFGIDVVMLAIAATLAYVARRTLFQNAVNARLTSLFLGVLVVDGIHRANAVRLGLPSQVVLPSDLLILGTATLAAGIFVTRPWAFASLFAFAGAILAAMFPTLAEVIFVVAACLMFSFMGLVYKPTTSKWRRISWLPRRREHDDAR
jgi:tRNA A-37 threonylcarbamoyl transferase component Bud32